MAIPTRDAPAVTLDEAGIQLGGQPIWSAATLAVEEGEFVAILGPNGSGKTTLLRVLLGLLPATQGRVRVLGRPPRRGNPMVGYVPQRRTLDPDMPVRGRDLVMLGVEGLRWGFALPGTFRRDQAIVQRAIDSVEASEYADRPIGQMSGGERQRLLLAQAMVGRPRLLLLDEPLANLDLRNQEAMTQLIARVTRAEGITVMLVTHDINPLLPVMSRVVYVAQGKVAIGTPEEIITSETLSILYGASVQVVRDDQGHYLCSGRVEDVHTHR